MFGRSPIAEWARAAAPPPTLTVSEWADLHRVLPETSAARGGRWRTATTPYLAGVMNAVHELGVHTVAVMKSHQVGCSEALNNLVGFFVEHAACPILLVHPTAAAAEAYSKERLSDMIRSTPALRAVVQDKRMPGPDGRPESTLSLKMFPGGFLALGGANSPNTFARWSVRLAIGDDVDRWPPVVGEEGDPGELLVNRTTSFHDRLAIFVSTPTLKGGRIDTLFARSDRRRFFVPCLRCGRFDYITWHDPEHLHVAFEERDPLTAHLRCPAAEHGGCDARLEDPERHVMVARGKWRPTAEAQEPGLTGFHVTGMLSPWVTLPELVAKFLAARARGPESLRVFINTQLGEGWEDRGARVEPHALALRLEDYGAGVDAPAGVVALTAGVDVQLDRFEVQVLGWGFGGESWVLDAHVVPGPPAHPDVQAALLASLDEPYRHASGAPLSISATCVDSGYLPEKVAYALAARRPRRIFAVKGIGGRFGEPSILKYDPRTPPVSINVDGLKLEVMLGLEMAAPGPGFMHLSRRCCDEEYLAQLTAEHREVRRKNGVSTMIWVEDRADNHALDSAVYGRAAWRLLVRLRGARTEEALLQQLSARRTGTP